jgi:hypothetical protein
MAYLVFLISPGIILSNILIKNVIAFLTVTIFIYMGLFFHGGIPFLQSSAPTIILIIMLYSGLVAVAGAFIEMKLLRDDTPQRRRKIVNPRFRK